MYECPHGCEDVPCKHDKVPYTDGAGSTIAKWIWRFGEKRKEKKRSGESAVVEESSVMAEGTLHGPLGGPRLHVYCGDAWIAGRVCFGLRTASRGGAFAKVAAQVIVCSTAGQANQSMCFPPRAGLGGGYRLR